MSLGKNKTILIHIRSDTHIIFFLRGWGVRQKSDVVGHRGMGRNECSKIGLRYDQTC